MKPLSLIEEIKIRLDEMQLPDCVILHPVNGKRLKIERDSVVPLQFGNRTLTVGFRFSYWVSKNEMFISPTIKDCLQIPAFCRYQLLRTDKALIIGPFIGILTANKKGYAKKLEGYAGLCGSINGAVMTFSPSQIMTKTKTINGAVYDPLKKEWIAGEYGYPASILKLVKVSRKLDDHLSAALGGRIFNDRRLNKMEMYQSLMSYPELHPFLPYTALYKDPEDVFAVLDRHKEVYIKPVNGTGGNGIHKVSISETGYSISRYSKTSKASKTIEQSRDQLSEYMAKSLTPRKYIIQQGIRLLEEKGRPIDFRLIMVRNGFGVWEDMGLVGRYGPSGSIVSNIRAGGSAKEGRDVLMKVMQINEIGVQQLRKFISMIGHETVSSLDAAGGHWGNIGIDFGYDKNGHLWLLEVNHNNPDHTVALDAGDRMMYQRTIEAIMQYAKKLAGFGKGLH